MKLRHKILLGFAVLTTALLGLEVTILLFMNRSATTMNDVVEKQFASEKLIKASNLIVAQIHADVWDAILDEKTRKIRSAELRERARDFYANLRKLNELLPKRSDNLDDLGLEFQWYMRFGTRILKFRDVREFKRENDVVEKFKEKKNDLIVRMDNTVADISREFESSLLNLRTDFQRTTAITLSLSIATIILAVPLSLILAGALTRPVETLTLAMKEVESGNFEVQTEIRAKDELGRLASAFNTMGRKLNEMARHNAALYESLEEKVRQRTAELAAAKEHAEKAQKTAEIASQAKSEFLSSMSHELRTPLNGILGYAQVLRQHPALRHDTDVQNGLEVILQSGTHLLNLIAEILDLAKIEARRIDIRETLVPLPEMLGTIGDTIRIQARQKGISFQVEFDEELPKQARLDEHHLRQVLLNLLANAVKFTEQGGVTLKVTMEAEGERDDSKSLANHLTFEIQDTGIGIAPEHLETIFEPFQQHHHPQRRREGVGLGLAISRQLVRMLGGELEVKSSPGQGSVFYFELPIPEIAAEEPNAPLRPRIINGYHGERRSLLVVDDDPANRGLLSYMLGPLGFIVREAEDGGDALRKALENTPDLILMDLMMPEMDGFEAMRAMRQLPALQKVPAFAVSADVFEDTRQRSLDAGFDDFLFKPVAFDLLVALLGDALKLEWIYSDAEPTRSPHAERTEEAMLPSALLETLYAGLITGDIEALRQQIEKAKQEHRTTAFLLRLERLAAGFQLDELEQALGAILDETARARALTKKVRPDSRPAILVVDDTPANLLGLFDLLSHRGWRVLVVANGQRALHQARSQRPDLILLDVHMPDTNGFDVCRCLKRDERTKEIPVLFLSAMSETIDRVNGFEAGGADYIVKPFRQEEVLTRVQMQLRLSRTYRKMKSEQHRFQALSEASFEGLIVYDRGRILEINHAVESLSGYSRQELQGSSLFDLLEPDFREDARRRMELDDTAPYVTQCRHRDGSSVPVEVQARPLEWQGVTVRLIAVRDIRERQQLQEENQVLRVSLNTRDRLGELIGKSPAMHRVYERLTQAAASDAPVILYGETGTGKELAARTLFSLAERYTKRFVEVNCGAIQETLFETHFFGFRKGAFTGAGQAQEGYVSRAEGGILFLDEVGELPLNMQVSLLRLLNDGRYTPVGDTVERQASVRIVAATNRNLRDLVHSGAMREDFFHRLHVLTLELPPLRQRKEDIPLLIAHFFQQNISPEETAPKLSPRIMQRLIDYDWPGNVRELFNELLRFMAHGDLELGGKISTGHPSFHSTEPLGHPEELSFLKADLALTDAVEAFERFYITRALEQAAGKKSRTAELLHLNRRTFYSKLKKLGLM